MQKSNPLSAWFKRFLFALLTVGALVLTFLFFSPPETVMLIMPRGIIPDRECGKQSANKRTHLPNLIHFGSLTILASRL
jgi:hypothetical protein